MSQQLIWHPEQLRQLRFLEQIQTEIQDLVRSVEQALQNYNWAKGSLNEHQYGDKLLAAGDSPSKLAKVMSEQQHNRALYESFRVRLVLARKKLDNNYKALQSEIKKLQAAAIESWSWGNNWNILAFNGLALWEELIALRPRITERLNEDLTEGQGAEALRKTFETALQGNPTGFEFDLRLADYASFWPVWHAEFFASYPYDCAKTIDALRAALVRLNGCNNSEELHFDTAKRNLNEPQYRQRLETALSAGDRQKATEVQTRQRFLRMNYAQAVLQGIHSWSFIDEQLQKLRWFVEYVEKERLAEEEKLAPEKSEDEKVVLMIDYIAARTWLRSFETGRTKMLQFKSAAQEPNAVTALASLREQFLALDTTLE